MSQHFWEQRYQTGDMPWEKGAPSPGLVDFLATHRDLPGETVCVPGCGTGHDVREWAGAGFRAYGYDLAPSAIQLAVDRTRAGGIPPPTGEGRVGENPPTISDHGLHPHPALSLKGEGTRAKFRLGDFLRDEPPFPFDWLWEHTLFCAIQPHERDLYVQAVRRWLKPGGHYLAVNYLIPDEDGPPFGTTRDELWRRFSPHFELQAEWVPRSYPNRTGLELMIWWRKRAR